MQLFEADVAQLRNAQPRGVSQFQHRLVTERGRSLQRRRRKELRDVGISKRFRQTLPTLRQRQVVRDIDRQELLVLRKAIEGTQRRDLEVNAFRTQPARGFGRLGVERAVALVFEEEHQVLQLDLLPIREILRRRPRGEALEKTVVIQCRALGLPPLMAEIDEEVFDQILH